MNDSATNPANTVLLWVGIAAGVVFIVAVVFFSGFYFGRNSGIDRDRDATSYPGMMYPDRSGQYPPIGPGMMGPNGPRAPGEQAPATTAPRP